ncbi:MAG: DUF2561 family protein [Mycobacterium sp.]
MTSDSANGELTGARSPETIDRIMVGVCGSIWLVLLAASVIATVALVRLGSGHAETGEKGSSWLLYTIIAISALVIAAAIPLLIRARRTALAEAEPAAETPATEAPARAAEAQTEKIRVFGQDPYASPEPATPRAAPKVQPALLDRLWLRGTTSLLGAMGLALTAVAVATYLLATYSDTAAWAALGVAAVITVAMPVILVRSGQALSEALDEA